jgi:spoIIIJ-associated protein
VGKNTEEAINKAASFLAVPPELLSFTLISTGSKGFFGLLGSKARIKVDTNQANNSEANNLDQDPDNDGKEEAKVKDSFFDQNKSGHKPKYHKDEKEINLSDNISEDKIIFKNVPNPVTKVQPGEVVQEGPKDAITEEVCAKLLELLLLMGFEPEIKSKRMGERIILEIVAPQNALLIGRKGASLDALQLLLNKMMWRSGHKREGMEENYEDNPMVIVDVEDYRARRHFGLVEKTGSIALMVLKTGKTITIPQLTAPERLLVHGLLEQVKGVHSKSHGFGVIRNVCVFPEGERVGEDIK